MSSVEQENIFSVLDIAATKLQEEHRVKPNGVVVIKEKDINTFSTSAINTATKKIQ